MDTYGFDNDQIAEMVMEYQLSIGIRVSADGCKCPSYLIRRREVLFPEFLKEAREQNLEPGQVVARFVRRLHEKCEQSASKGIDSMFARNIHEFKEFSK